MTSIQALTMVFRGINPLRRLSITVLAGCCMALSAVAQQLLEGDLIFTCSENPNAITQVTHGIEDYPIDHVAIVHRIGGESGPLFVIEAIKPAVCLTPIDTFLCRNTSTEIPYVIVGRVNTSFDTSMSIRRCLLMVGKPYDDLYYPGDSAVYCSELVQSNYVSTSGNQIFEPIPMSFHDQTGTITQYWQDFYSRRGLTVPEGAPGSNPGELSRRDQITIIGKYPRLL